MGCWLSACALSGLTIPSSCRVGVVFLMSGYYPSVISTSYTDGWCRWVSPPLWGLDDSYGRVVLDEAEDPQLISMVCAALASFRQVGSSAEASPNPLPAVTPTTAKDLWDVQDRIHDDEGLIVATLEGIRRVRTRLGYAIVREDVWKALAELAPTGTPSLQMETIRAWARKEKVSQDAARSLHYYFAGMGGGGSCPLAFEDWEDKVGAAPSPALVDRMAETRRVQYAMSALRLSLMPGCGAGSQQCNTEGRIAYFAAMSKIAEQDYAQEMERREELDMDL